VVSPGWLIARAVSPQIAGDCAVAGVGQRRQLVPPGPPELGVTVEEENQGAVTGLHHVEPATVCADEVVRPRTVDEDDRLIRRSISRHGISVGGALLQSLGSVR